ncbi:MAG: hypothetical protein WA885_17920 [Phormidesmis sp.]
MILNIFKSSWRKIRQDPTGWGMLLLFAGGVSTLLILMKWMSTVPSTL